MCTQASTETNNDMVRLLTFAVAAIDDVDEEEELRSDVFCLFFGLLST